MVACKPTPRPERHERDNEHGGIAVMVGLFALIFASVTWAMLAAAQRHMVGRQLHNVADSLALAGAAMVLEQGANGDQVKNWNLLVARVGKPNAPRQDFTARARVLRVKDKKKERRLVEVTVEADHRSTLGSLHFRVVSYGYVNERLYSDEWPVLVLVLDATGSMKKQGGQGKRGKVDLWKRLKEVIRQFLGLGLPARVGLVAFNQYVASWVSPGSARGGSHVAHFPKPPKGMLWGTKYHDCRQVVSSADSDQELCDEAAKGKTSQALGPSVPSPKKKARGQGNKPKAERELRETISCRTHSQALLTALKYIEPNNATNLKLPLEKAAELLRQRPYVQASKRAVIVSDGVATDGGSVFSWVPFFGGASDQEVAITAAKALRRLKAEGAALFAIETARYKRKTEFLIKLAGPPLIAGEPDPGNPSCGTGLEVEHPFYKQLLSMSDVSASLLRLSQALCTFGPLKVQDGDPVAVYLTTPQQDKKLEQGKDYDLCAGWVQLTTDTCRKIGTQKDHELVIRWGRPRLTSGPDGP
ncbi:MAG: VWA domain-containing protein [Deltaproteobacteria bacterium]|nr:VWA domain-containing protein [Deltaproteobacteria bacterium]